MRSRMDLLFLALILLVILDTEIEKQKQQALFFVLLPSLVISYYTFSYMFVLLCLCAVILYAVPWDRSRSKRLQAHQALSLSILVLSVALVYLWWGIATQGTAEGFLAAIQKSTGSLVQIATVEARTATEQKAYATGLQGPAEVLNLISYYAITALAAIGAVLAILSPKETKFEREYRLLMISSLLLWLLAFAMPGLSYLVSSVSVLPSH